MKVVTIVGSLGSGKSLIKDMIADRVKIAWVPFAKPVKDTAYGMGWDGQKDKKGRRLLQLLGTECGRKCIDSDIWVKKWKHAVAECPHNIVVVVDDMRFSNELKTILDLSDTVETYIVRVARYQGWWLEVKKKFFPFLLHPSERPLDLRDINILDINNNGSIEDLRNKLEPLLLALETDV